MCHIIADNVGTKPGISDVTSAITPVEYCQWETFEASCPHGDQVVLIMSARYGRMNFSRCVREDHGNIGCAADVISHLDRICSGRRWCQLTIPDSTLHAAHPCPRELMPYLEVSYSCVTGMLSLYCVMSPLLSLLITRGVYP